MPAIDRPYAAQYQAAINEKLEKEYGLTPVSQPLKDEHIKRLLTGILENAAADYPEQFSTDTNPQSILFRASVEYPRIKTDTEKGRIMIQLRPYSDHTERNLRYIAAPARYSIETNTDDEARNNEIHGIITESLESKGFINYSLSTGGKQGSSEKEIPKEWIDISRVRILPIRSGLYTLLITSEKGRIPTISYCLGTRDEVLAKKILAIVQSEFLPRYMPGGDRADQPITLNTIARYINERCTVDEKQPKLPARQDTHFVTANGKPIIKLPIPQLTKNKNGYTTTIKFSPPESCRLPRRIDESLNTSDKFTAEARAEQIRTLVEIILHQYFEKYPTHSLVTEIDPASKKQELLFKNPEPNEKPPVGQVFLRSLIDEHLKPVLAQFNRYIYWDTKIVSDGNRFKITCEVRRNEINEGLPEELAPLQGPFDLYAPDEETAKNFARQLKYDMTREQYLFGCERPVSQYGQNSMGVSVRESLRNSLESFASVETPNTYVFNTLTGRIK